MSDCPTEGFTIQFYGVTDQSIDPVVFYPEEIGFRTVSFEKTKKIEQLGNTHWVNEFSIIDFTGDPKVEGCDLDFMH